MENLSVLEASLLLAVQMRPGLTAAEHATLLDEPYIKVLHAQNALKNWAYILVDHDQLTVNPDYAQEENAQISKEFAPENPVVHRIENDVPAKDLAVKPDMNKVTEESLLQLLREANGRPRTALELARLINPKAKGTVTAWPLRRLIEQNLVIKRNNAYFIVTEDDKVIHKQVIADPRRIMTSPNEVRAVIQNMREAFTADTCHAAISKAFVVDKAFFLEVFGDLAMDGYFNVMQDGDYVDPAANYDPSNLHSVRRIMEKSLVAEELDAYTLRIDPPYDMHKIIESLHVPNDMVQDYFTERGYAVENVREIIKKAVAEMPVKKAVPCVEVPNRQEKKPVREVRVFTEFAALDMSAVIAYIDGGVRLPIFVKHFNLDPNKSIFVRDSLLALGLARHDHPTNTLYPAKKTDIKSVEPEQATHIKITVDAEPTVAQTLPTAIKETVEALSAPGAKTHVEDPSDPMYGHKIVSYKDNVPQVSYMPDQEWLDAQKATYENVDIETQNADDLLRAASDEFVRKIAPDFLDIGQLSEPTGHPPQAWTAQEKSDVLGSVDDDDADEEIEEYLHALDPHFRDLTQKICSEPQNTKPSNMPPVQQWAMTLQMLEQRLTFEHQTIAATQLRAIREYLEKL